MAKLGSFGAAIREIEPDAEHDTFDYFGEEFRVVGVVPNVVSLKICAAMAGRLSGIDQDAALYEALQYALTAPAAEPDGRPDRSQWRRFYAVAAEHRGHGDELVSLVLSILGAQSGFPTAPQSTSEDGSSAIGESSNSSASDSRDSSHLVPVATLLGG